jgi:hypothetical protein
LSNQSIVGLQGDKRQGERVTPSPPRFFPIRARQAPALKRSTVSYPFRTRPNFPHETLHIPRFARCPCCLSILNARFLPAIVVEEKNDLFCDHALLSPTNICGLHCGMGVIDCVSCQAYNVCVIMASCERCPHGGAEERIACPRGGGRGAGHGQHTERSCQAYCNRIQIGIVNLRENRCETPSPRGHLMVCRWRTYSDS